MMRYDNESFETAQQFAKLPIQGTDWLAFRDIPHLIQRFVKGKKGLDLGCGTGRSTRFLKELGLTATGMDISGKMIYQARALDPEIDYRFINDGKIPSSNESHDFAFSSFVLLEIPTKDEMKKILNEVHRVLKKEGIFIIITANEGMYSHEWLTLSSDYPENKNLQSGSIARVKAKDVGIEFHDYFWTDEDHRQLFAQTGFRLVHTHSPIGKETDGISWEKEMEASPFTIYVLSKTENSIVCPTHSDGSIGLF